MNPKNPEAQGIVKLTGRHVEMANSRNDAHNSSRLQGDQAVSKPEGAGCLYSCAEQAF